MLAVAIIYGGVLLVGLAFAAFVEAVLTAPEGYEDRHGFHLGRLDNPTRPQSLPDHWKLPYPNGGEKAGDIVTHEGADK